MRWSIPVALLGLALGGCFDDDPGGSPTLLSRLDLRVDFTPSAQALEIAGLERQRQAQRALAAQTPSAYRIKLCALVLWHPGTDDRFTVFSEAEPAACPVFTFEAAAPLSASLLPAGARLPEAPGYNVAELHIVYLEQALSFRLAGGEDVGRSLRIYFSTDGPYRPGDVTVVHPDDRGDNWAFGPGNLSADPALQGLPRAQAYALPAWPRGHSPDAWGPFGGGSFWSDHPPDPFVWRVPLPVEGDVDHAELVFEVADSWRFTDANDDGVYDWPADYGGDWHMEFPRIVGVPVR